MNSVITRKIVLTGGGTAGHVTPNLALIEVLQSEGWKIDYIGSADGVEKGMVEAMKIPFHAIKTGKLRRYFSWKNFLDPFNVILGMLQSILLLRRLKPDVVFSKGGFVALPVVIGAFVNRIPIIAHESDMTPGLANRLSLPFVNTICVTFSPAKAHFKASKRIEVTGTPIRSELFQGDKLRGLTRCGFTTDKPCILVVGGSQGSVRLNAVVREALPALTVKYQVIHLCGKGKCDPALANTIGYYQMEYANQELADLLAACDLVISRSGANALSEILALVKPHVLVPLSMKSSRGDQIHNARYFQSQGVSTVLDDETLSAQGLIKAVEETFAKKDELQQRIKALGVESATKKITQMLTEMVG